MSKLTLEQAWEYAKESAKYFPKQKDNPDVNAKFQHKVYGTGSFFHDDKWYNIDDCSLAGTLDYSQSVLMGYADLRGVYDKGVDDKQVSCLATKITDGKITYQVIEENLNKFIAKSPVYNNGYHPFVLNRTAATNIRVIELSYDPDVDMKKLSLYRFVDDFVTELKYHHDLNQEEIRLIVTSIANELIKDGL